MKKTKTVLLLHYKFIGGNYFIIHSNGSYTAQTIEIVDQTNNQPKKIHIPPNSHIFKLVIPGWKAARHHVLNPHFDSAGKLATFEIKHPHYEDSLHTNYLVKYSKVRPQNNEYVQLDKRLRRIR